MQQQVSVITLGIADLARSRRFYCDGFGWAPGVPGRADRLLPDDKLNNVNYLNAEGLIRDHSNGG